MPIPNRVRRRAHKPEANGASDNSTVEQKRNGKKLSNPLQNRVKLGARKLKVNGSSYDSGCSVELPNRAGRDTRKPHVNEASTSGYVAQRKSREKKLNNEEVSKIWTWLASQHAEADDKLDRIAARSLLFPNRPLYTRCDAKERGHCSPVECVGSENNLAALDNSDRDKINETVNAEGLLNSTSTASEENIGDPTPELYNPKEKGRENQSIDVNSENSHTIAIGKRLSVKLHARARYRTLAAEDVTSFFLPPGVTSPGEHSILFSEAVEVFEKDLGIFLTDKEREYILDCFGFGGDMVDVKDLLHSCGMWSPNKLGNPSLELNLDETASQNGHPYLDVSSSQENSSIAVDAEREIDATYHSVSPHMGIAPCIQRKYEGTLISSAKPENGVKITSRDKTQENNLLIAENEYLRQELNAFDMEFFDELEDLKFAYSNLKKNVYDCKDEGCLLRQKNSVHLDNSMDGILQSENRSEVTSVPCVMRSPARGAQGMNNHISRLEKQWKGGETSYPLVSSPENQSSKNGGEGSTRSSITQKQNECCNNNETAIAYHNFKLAWEVVNGGMTALEEFRKSIMKLVHDGHAYLTVKQTVGVLNKTCYLMNDWDINVVKMGMETNEKGQMNTKELLQIIEDIAIQSSWYTDVCGISIYDDKLPPPFRFYPEKGVVSSSWNSISGRCPNEEYFTENKRLEDNNNNNNKDMDYGFAAIPIENVITKVRRQLERINLPAINIHTLAEQLGRPFYHRDRFLTGTLNLPDTRCAMEELGIKLGEDELHILARRFQQTVQPNDEEVLLPTTEVLTYKPLL